MSIKVECSACKRGYTVDEQKLGQRVKCKSCGTVFTIEAAGAPNPDELFADADFEQAPAERPAATPAKFYNPVETNASAKPAFTKSTAPVARNSIFSSSPGADTETSPNLLRAMYLIIGLFILFSVGLGAYWTLQAFSDLKDSKLASATIGSVWEWIALFDVLVFALMAPLMWAGVWATSKVVDFRMPDSPYLRAASVVCIAGILVGIAELMPSQFAITLLVLIAPAIYFVLRLAFDLDWAQSGIALVIGGGGTVLGGFISSMLLGLIMSGSVFSAVDSARQIASANAPRPAAASSNQSSNAATPGATPDAPVPKDRAAYDRFKQLVLTKTALDLSQTTRDEAMPAVTELKTQLAALKPAFHEEPDWENQAKSVDSFEQKVMALPATKFGHDYYAEAGDADDWTTGSFSRGRLAPEVSFQHFKFQPPMDMHLDLRSSDTSLDGMLWIGNKHPDAKMSVRTIPRKDARQRRPAVIEQPAALHEAEQKGLFIIDGASVTPALGQINGMTATRVSAKDGTHAAEYYLPTGNEWLVIKIFPIVDAKLAKIMDAAARTVRQTDPGEPPADPHAPKLIAPRLVDEPEIASAILAEQGEAGEDAVLALLDNSDRTMRIAALTWLKANATVRAMSPLLKFSTDRDQGLVDLAKAGLARLKTVASNQPDGQPMPDADLQTVTGLLTDLNSADANVRKQAVGRLAQVAPIESKRHVVSARLSGMLRNHEKGPTVPEIIQALTPWADASAASDLLALLKDTTDATDRRAVLKACAILKPPGAAQAIVKWLRVDPSAATDALIEFGPDAEPTVIPSLKNPDVTSRIQACRVLEKIGTAASAPELRRVCADPKDVNTHAAAKSALDAIMARTGQVPSPK